LQSATRIMNELKFENSPNIRVFTLWSLADENDA
jgi:hypothetical protein